MCLRFGKLEAHMLWQIRYVNFALLERAALVRYKRLYNLKVKNGASKDELIAVCV